MLIRLIYTSRISDQFGAADIRAIVDSSARNNTMVGVTGILYFGKNTFFQCLEGERAEVNRTYNRLIPDPRHLDSVLLSYAPVNDRLFADWDMAYLDAADENIKNIITIYSKLGEFKAGELSDRQADNLIVDFSQALAKSKRMSF